jgi:hypothetical protein
LKSTFLWLNQVQRATKTSFSNSTSSFLVLKCRFSTF